MCAIHRDATSFGHIDSSGADRRISSVRGRRLGHQTCPPMEGRPSVQRWSCGVRQKSNGLPTGSRHPFVRLLETTSVLSSCVNSACRVADRGHALLRQVASAEDANLPAREGVVWRDRADHNDARRNGHGENIAKYPLEPPLVFDGMIAAESRSYVSCADLASNVPHGGPHRFDPKECTWIYRKTGQRIDGGKR